MKRITKSSLIILFTGGVLLLFAGYLISERNGRAWLRYESGDGELSFQYPPDWLLAGNIDTLLTLERKSPWMNVIVGRWKSSPYGCTSLEECRRENDYIATSTHVITVGGKPALRGLVPQVGHEALVDPKLLGLIDVPINDHTEYWITYQPIGSAAMPEFEAILDSFSFRQR